MVNGIASGLGSDALARMASGSAALKARVEQLALQAGDGRRAHNYGDEAPDARQAISLRSEIARREATSQGLTHALGRADIAQLTLSRLAKIASDFAVTTDGLRNADPAAIKGAATAARDALSEVGGLLNEKFEGAYLFSGSDTGNPALRNGGDLSASGMSARISAAMAGLAGSGAASALGETRAAALDDSAANTPFSPFLADPSPAGRGEKRPTTLLGDDTRIEVGLWASRNAEAVSRGGDTTGSWARDLIRGLMTLAALPDATGASAADVKAVVASARESLTSANGALGAEAGALGQTQARLETARTRHADVNTALRGQLAGLEEVDLAATLTSLQDTRTRLEASYKALSIFSELSLANFLR